MFDLILRFTLIVILFSLDCHSSLCEEREYTTITVTDEDFQALVNERKLGLAGVHKNVDPTPYMPATEHAILDWAHLSVEEKERLAAKQEEMYRQGKMTLLVMAGGEATRFGGPKTFTFISDELGEFLEVKAANLNWMRKTYGAQVPMYILTSEKRLQEFKSALAERDYYGLNEADFRWYVQGMVDTFIPTNEELRYQFKGNELEQQLAYANANRQVNPDGIYRFNGERRKIPGGHFDAVASFIISGHCSDALAQGIEYALVVNIDNLQAILKNDGMIAYFAEKGDDFGFLLAEKNLLFTITNKKSGKEIINKLIVRFRDHVLSFDGIQEHWGWAEKEGYSYVINTAKKAIDLFDVATGRIVETNVKIKAETGGTLVQPTNQKGEPIGEPIMKEGFELPNDFDHLNAHFFNTNTIVVNLKSLLKFLSITEKELAEMSFDERALFVREKLIKQIKANFEFKNHEVEGEYPHLGVVKNGKTKIPVSQLTRIMLQVAHLKGAKVGYIFAPRSSVFAPVKEPEDKKGAAANHQETLKRFTLYAT